MRSIRIFSLYIAVIIALVSTPFRGQSAMTLLEGTAPTYAGDELIFQVYSNMISFRVEEVARCTVNDSGYFTCALDLDETRLIFTNPGSYNCYFFVEPGYKYNIRFPAKRERTVSEEMNPYFEPTRVHIVARITGSTDPLSTNTGREDLNFLIRAFNDAFYPHYYKYVINAATNNPVKSDISKDIEHLTTPFDSADNEFFRSYMHYRIGLLKMFGDHKNARNICKEYFISRPLLYNNPAYMELFNEVFNDYFLNFSITYPKIAIMPVINRQKSLTALKEAMKADELLKDQSLKELVIIKGIFDAFYKEQFSRASLLIILDSISYTSVNPIHAGIARNIKSQVTNLLSGFEPPSLKLPDKDNNLISLADLKGKYIYLSFCNSFSYSCLKEFELLRILNNRYKEHLQLVTVIMDGEQKMLRDLVDRNGFEWLFLHHDRQRDLRSLYDVKALPSYFLIGPDGRLVLSPAPSPAENFEQVFLQIMRSRGGG